MQTIEADILFEGLWPAVPEHLPITAVTTDSRQIVPGCVFVAIQGERVDGHDFAAAAMRDGAAVVVAQRPLAGVPVERTVLVKDPLDAMIGLGANYRRQFQPLMLGITGSVGKTTTKEFCSAIFSSFGKTVKTEGNQNNEIGLPNTLFKLDEETQYAVVEMGMQGLGEIHKLTMAARPSGALITKIGTAHLEALGSLENILKAKMEICAGLPYGAPLVINGDDRILCEAKVPDGIQAVCAGIHNEECDVRATNIRQEGITQRFDIVDRQFGKLTAYIPALGMHNVYNALLAYTAATRLGLNAEQASAALAGYKPSGMRQNIIELQGVTLIEDCYNANPDSMAAALQTLALLEVKGKRVAVLGDMLELGDISEQEHSNLAEVAAQNKVDKLITVGALAELAVGSAKARGIEAVACADNAAAAQELLSSVHAGDAVLVKASRGMKFEEILQHYQQLAGFSNGM